jgi:hypothetical protein
MFSSGFSCRIGNETLSYDIRSCRRTIIRQLEILASKEAPDGTRRKPIIIRRRRYPDYGGRLADEIRLVGFKRWFFANYGASRRAHQARKANETEKIFGGDAKCQNVTKPRSADKNITKGYVTDRESPDRGQQESPTNKNLTLTLESEDARTSAREDSISDFEVKVSQVLRTELGETVFESWFSQVRFQTTGDIVRVHAPLPFVRNWIQQHYGDLIRRVCQAIQADITGVDFIAKPALNDNVKLPTGKVGS